jgi:hypothetical protein
MIVLEIEMDTPNSHNRSGRMPMPRTCRRSMYGELLCRWRRNSGSPPASSTYLLLSLSRYNSRETVLAQRAGLRCWHQEPDVGVQHPDRQSTIQYRGCTAPSALMVARHGIYAAPCYGHAHGILKVQFARSHCRRCAR